MGKSLDPFHDNHPLSTKCTRYLNPDSWHCTMIWSATLGLPLSLEGIGAIATIMEFDQAIRCGSDTSASVYDS